MRGCIGHVIEARDCSSIAGRGGFSRPETPVVSDRPRPVPQGIGIERQPGRRASPSVGRGASSVPDIRSVPPPSGADGVNLWRSGGPGAVESGVWRAGGFAAGERVEVRVAESSSYSAFRAVPVVPFGFGFSEGSEPRRGTCSRPGGACRCRVGFVTRASVWSLPPDDDLRKNDLNDSDRRFGGGEEHSDEKGYRHLRFAPEPVPLFGLVRPSEPLRLCVESPSRQ